MAETYFHRVHRLSPTRFWINNPTPREAAMAIEAGAISCTTNPTYGSRQLRHPETREETLALIDRAVAGTRDDDEAADLVSQALVKRILGQFAALHWQAPGRQGFVSLQGNPFRDGDADHVVQEALRYRNLGPNFIAKIPVIEAGMKSIERLVAQGVPVIATEVMGVAQMTAICECYERGCRAGGTRPPFYLTHITGIFDEYLQEHVKRQGIPIDRDLVWQAGCIVAREQYRVFKERGCPGIMLGGGARGLHHFTEMVGSEMHVTINWEGTADRLIADDPPVIWRMFNPAPQRFVDELLEKLPDFRKAYREDGLAPAEFGDYGPVKLFRTRFEEGWTALRAECAARRKR